MCSSDLPALADNESKPRVDEAEVKPVTDAMEVEDEPIHHKDEAKEDPADVEMPAEAQEHLDAPPAEEKPAVTQERKVERKKKERANEDSDAASSDEEEVLQVNE